MVCSTLQNRTRPTGTRAERVQNRTPEQIVDVPVPQLMEAIVEVLPSSPQERVQNRTPEQIVDVPVPRIMETIVEVLPSSPQERVQNCTPEQIVDVPVPRTIEAIVEQISVVPQTAGRIAWACASTRAFRADPRTTCGCGLQTKVWTGTTCFDLEMLWSLCLRSWRNCRGGL